MIRAEDIRALLCAAKNAVQFIDGTRHPSIPSKVIGFDMSNVNPVPNLRFQNKVNFISSEVVKLVMIGTIVDT